MPYNVLRRIVTILSLLLLGWSATASANLATTDPPADAGFPLSANTAFCEPGYFGPFVDCTPWEGVTVSFVSSDGSFATSCVTSGTERAAGCVVDVPFGAIITASIEPGAIPAGYVLERSTSVEIAIPAGPPEGEFSGASFVLFPVEAPPAEPPATGAFPLSAATAYCEPGYGGPFVGCNPWEGVTVSFVSGDGAFSTSCVTAGTERAAGCTVDVPFGATITASIDPAVIPAGYVLERSTSREFQIPDGPPEGEFSVAAFVLFPEAASEEPDAPPAAGDDTSAAPAGTDAIQPAGMPVEILAATCDAPLPDAPVVALDDALEPTGAGVGAVDAVPVATSYTEIAVPFDTLADGSHVIAVFSADDTGILVACGGIGGSLSDNGALAVGLLPEGEDGNPAVAYISPVDDGASSAITVFVTLPPTPES